jgi:phage shock protein A
MGIFRRVSDIVSANLNDLIERCEDPETMLRQAVREMEASIDRSLDGAARAIGSKNLLEKEVEGHRRGEADSAERAERAVRSGDLEAARAAIERRRAHQRLLLELEGELASAKKCSSTMEKQVRALRSKLAEAERKLAILSARKRVAEARKSVRADSRKPRSAGFIRFERMERRIEEAVAAADALDELHLRVEGGGGGPEHPDPGVEEELAALRARLGK